MNEEVEIVFPKISTRQGYKHRVPMTVQGTRNVKDELYYSMSAEVELPHSGETIPYCYQIALKADKSEFVREQSTAKDKVFFRQVTPLREVGGLLHRFDPIVLNNVETNVLGEFADNIIKVFTTRR